ncbi:hypothetical protein TWF281_002209 [Arthrobotrys megalospora]
MATFYLANPQVQESIEKVQSQERRRVLSLWSDILSAEFPANDGWFVGFTNGGGLPYNVVHLRRQWDHSVNILAIRRYLLVFALPHDSYDFGRHRKFGDDAREAILQLMTLTYHDWISDFHITIAAASEFVVEFWEWTGRQFGRPDLKRLTIEDKVEGTDIFGPLHIIDDAEKVHRMIQYVKERAESNVDTDGIDMYMVH